MPEYYLQVLSAPPIAGQLTSGNKDKQQIQASWQVCLCLLSGRGEEVREVDGNTAAYAKRYSRTPTFFENSHPATRFQLLKLRLQVVNAVFPFH